MRIKIRTVSVITDGAGDFSTSADFEGGFLLRISYVPDGTSPLDTGADLTVTESNTGTAVYTQANIGVSAFTKLPRLPIASAVDGVDSTTVFDYIPVNDKLTVTIAAGGASKVGIVYLYIGEPS